MTRSDKNSWDDPQTRRKMMQLLGGTTVAGMLAGCPGDGGDGDGDGDGSSDGDGGGGEKVLRTALPNNPTNLEPANYNLYADSIIGEHVYEGLYKLNFEFQPEPRVASDMPEQPDDTTYVFPLRENIVSHNGTEITAEDVKASVDYVRNKESARASYHEQVDSVEIVDDYTIEMSLTEPNALFIPILGSRLGFRVSTAESRDIDPEGLTTQYSSEEQGIGTGPYQLVEWSANERLVLEAHDDYWADDVPTIDRIEWPIVTEASTRQSRFLADETDHLSEPPRTNIRQLRERNDIESDSVASVRFELIWFNNGTPPFDDWRTRRAVSHAVDREQILNNVYQGLGTTAIGFGIPDTEWEMPSLEEYYTYDMDRAKDFLDDSNYDGMEFSIFTVPGRHEQTSQVLLESLNELGMNADIVVNEYPSNYAPIREEDAPGLNLQNAPVNVNPANAVWRWGHPNGDVSWLSGGGIQGEEGEEYLDLHAEMVSASSMDQVIERFKPIQELVAEYAPTHPYLWNELSEFWWPRVQNYQIHPSGYQRFWDTDIQS